MPSSREDFFQRVRQALAQGRRGSGPENLPLRGNLAYQGGGPDLGQRFSQELAAAGGQPHIVPDRQKARERVLELVQQRSPQKILLGHGPLWDNLNLAEPLLAQGREVVRLDGLTPASCRDPFFRADLSITAVDYLIAETGTVVMSSGAGAPRSLSLLPPVHIALAERRQLLPDLFDLFELFSAGRTSQSPALPSGLTLITGPSKTGDIELRLVTGVHGPGEIHVILLQE